MDSLQQTSWGPRPAAVAAVGLGGVVIAIASVMLVTDVPGRILLGVAGTGMLVFASISWRARPKLAITPDGLVLRGLWRSTTLRHNDIKLTRITEFRRIGRKVRLLEIDTADGRLHVFTRWDLGTDPIDVLDALTAAGYTG